MKKSLLLILLVPLLSSCPKFQLPGLGGSKAAKLLNNTVIMPPGSFQVDDSDLVTSSDITVYSTGNSGTVAVTPGESSSAQISFEAANGVTHAAMRFGNSGKTWMVPLSSGSGSSSGTINVPFTIPPELCDDLSSICHDIKCYEFAARETSGGTYKISRANINDLAMMCGNCDEPSCKDLLGDNCIGGGNYEGCNDYEDYCGNTWTSCCQVSGTSVDCYYLFMGNRYDCDGADCVDAAIEMAEDRQQYCKSAN